MAEQSAPDVVNQTLSVGDRSPSGANEDNLTRHTTGEGNTTVEQGANNQQSERFQQEDQAYPAATATLSSLQEHSPTNAAGIESSLPIDDNQAENTSQKLDTDGSASRDQSVGELSVASETETHKPEVTLTAEDAKLQDATGATRKTTSFKPVTFQKYSAVKVAGLNAGIKSGAEKVPSSSTQPSIANMPQGSRPRLVAKSAGGLRDTGTKSFKAGGKNSAGPDPMQVWNKNRPVAPPSTKHLTDEELKQQYGIHMTSRIEADGESKEAKWADIDDDEDDWAPDNIEWSDGTKVTFNNASNPPLPQEAMSTDENTRDTPEAQAAVQMKHSQLMSSIGPNATVLKIGANAERQQAQRGSHTQRGPSDTQLTSALKSPAPVPAKSPWAALPPVDKMPPITINPQVIPGSHVRQLPTPVTDQSYPGPPAPSQAQEISADDFNRSWRDSQPGQTRELFMPNSGRYEAVSENRRRGSRNDQNFRAPAVLQRPSNDARASAEPISPFPLSRPLNDQERAAWGRRRASSIQSGGSGHFGRRMSVGRPGEPAQSPRESISSLISSGQVAASDAVSPPRGVHIQPNAAMPPPPPPGGQPGPTPDLITDQKRRMAESARAAIQRRREEEEKEEAAKRERIRLKLEQLGPPPTDKAKVEEEKIAPVPRPEEATATISSPPKPPVPEAMGEPMQYGMMKVYHPDNVKKLSPQAEKIDMSPARKVNDEQHQLAELAKSPLPTINGINVGPEVVTETQPGQIEQKSPSGNQNSQSWKGQNAAAESVSSWNSRDQHVPAIAESLWGPLSHDKALGNGTFDQRLTGLSGRDQQQSWLQGRNLAHEKPQQLASTRPTRPEHGQSSRSFPSPEQRPIAANSEVDSFQPIGKPLPIGRPQTQNATSQRWQPSAPSRPVNTGVAAWNNFHVVASRDERAETERFNRELAASREEEARTGIRKTAQYKLTETWKEVDVAGQSGDRQIASINKGTPTPSFASPQPYSGSGSGVGNGLPVRGSRFFPAETKRAVTYSHTEVPPSPSPPPAEECASQHPAFDGDRSRPVINLPVPKAVVNLPKPQQTSSPAAQSLAPPRTFAAAVAAQPPTPQTPVRAVSSPMVSGPEWQNRFNDLFGKKASPKKQHVAVAVASATREPLEVVPVTISAAVSLPPKEVGAVSDSSKMSSKDVEEEEDLFEDRDPGSQPSVRLPREVSNKLLHPAAAPQFRPKGRLARLEIDPITVPTFENSDTFSPRGQKANEIIFFVHLPGSQSFKKTLLRKGVSIGQASRSARTPFARNNKKGPSKSRDSSGSFPNSNSSNSNAHSGTPPTANGAVPSPRAGFSHNSTQGWRPGHYASAGVAH